MQIRYAYYILLGFQHRSHQGKKNMKIALKTQASKQQIDPKTRNDSSQMLHNELHKNKIFLKKKVRKHQK